MGHDRSRYEVLNSYDSGVTMEVMDVDNNTIGRSAGSFTVVGLDDGRERGGASKEETPGCQCYAGGSELGNRTHTHTNITHAHTCTHTHAHTHCTHTRAHTYTQTHTHTCTHTLMSHTQSQMKDHEPAISAILEKFPDSDDPTVSGVLANIVQNNDPVEENDEP